MRFMVEAISMALHCSRRTQLRISRNFMPYLVGACDIYAAASMAMLVSKPVHRFRTTSFERSVEPFRIAVEIHRRKLNSAKISSALVDDSELLGCSGMM
jgi:hypothetical protein